MVQCPHQTSDHSAKRLLPATRTLALLWAGLSTFILASSALHLWQSSATPLGRRLEQVLFLILPIWLLLSLCVLGLWTSRLTAARTQSGGRVLPVLAGTLAAMIAIIPVLIAVAAICSRAAYEDQCLDLLFFYFYLGFFIPGVCTGGVLSLLPPCLAAALLLVGSWVAKRMPRRDGKP